MNFPWYGWRRWTCFVRSRSGSSTSDQERSRSSVAYSSSCVTATRPDSTSRLEGLRNPLDASLTHGDHVEADREPPELWTRVEPGLGGATQAPLLLRRDHLQWVAEPRAPLLLDLDEPQCSSTPDDQIELVAGGPDVLAEDPPPAQPIPPHRFPLGRLPRAGSRQPPPRSRNRAPGSSAGARPTDRGRGRSRNGRA